MIKFEHDILRVINGENIAGVKWGAAMGAALEFLEGSGYVQRFAGNYLITEKGKDALEQEPTP